MKKYTSYISLLFIGLFAFGGMYYSAATKKRIHSKTIKVKKTKLQVFSDIDVDDFIELMTKKKGVLIDVRTTAELESGRINGALNIDLYSSKFTQRLKKINKNEAVYVYSAVGGRGHEAMMKMKELGFVEVYNLRKGIRGWKVTNHEIEK